jgi:hypothetical protein
LVPRKTILVLKARRTFDTVFRKDTEKFGKPEDVEVAITRLDDLGIIQKTVNRHVLSVRAPTKKRPPKRAARAAELAEG